MTIQESENKFRALKRLLANDLKGVNCQPDHDLCGFMVYLSGLCPAPVLSVYLTQKGEYLVYDVLVNTDKGSTIYDEYNEKTFDTAQKAVNEIKKRQKRLEMQYNLPESYLTADTTSDYYFKCGGFHYWS